MAFVNFKRGTKAQYSALASKNDDTLYFVTDNDALYLGGTLIGSNIKNVEYNSSTGVITVSRFTGDSSTFNIKDLVTGQITLTEVKGSDPITVSTSNKVATVSLNIDSTTLKVDDNKKLTVNASGVSNKYNIVKTSELVYTLYEKAPGADSSTSVGTINIPKDQFLEKAEVKDGKLVLTWKLADDKGDGTAKVTEIPVTDFFKGVTAEGDTYITATASEVSTGTDKGKTKISVSVKDKLWTDVDSKIDTKINTYDASVKAADTSVLNAANTANISGVTSTGKTITVSTKDATSRAQNIEVSTANIVTAGEGLSVANNKVKFTVADIVDSGSALVAENGKLSIQWGTIA